MNYRIKGDQYKQCWDFAREQFKTSSKEVYTNRGGGGHIVKQIAAGKMGELAAHSYLKEYTNCLIITPPQFDVRDSSEKSYACDITCRHEDVHVKTCMPNTREKYGTSWVFQAQDPVVTEPTCRDAIMLMEIMELTGRFADIYMYAIAPADVLKRLNVYEPLKTEKSSKVAIYAGSLPGTWKNLRERR